MAARPDCLVRKARREDLPAIVRLLADDELGAQREHAGPPLPDRYREAFERIDSDPAHELIVAEAEGVIIGTLQLSILPYLTYEGGTRGQIEAVRVARERRGQRIGERLGQWAINRVRERGCHMVQLTTDKRRGDVVQFYERLGFQSHMKA